MSFFKRLAKLQSKVEFSGGNLKVGVYDDELSPNEPVMWLVGEITDIKSACSSADLSKEETMDIIENQGYEEEDKVLDVNIVNVNDQLYFNLPEKRKTMAAAVLFKNFLNYYNQNWGKNSSYWMPVRADFANYDLQQTFKRAVDEKGVFPEVSKLISGETTESEWNESYYNINNRENLNNKTPELIAGLREKGVTVDDNGLVSNTSLTIFKAALDEVSRKVFQGAAFDKLITNYLRIKIDGPNVNYYIPLKSLDSIFGSDNDFNAYLNEPEAKIFKKDNYQKMIDAEQNIRIVLDGYSIDSLKTYGQNVDQFFESIKQEFQSSNVANAMNKRLIKKNSSK
jgi:hypothetical protein